MELTDLHPNGRARHAASAGADLATVHRPVDVVTPADGRAGAGARRARPPAGAAHGRSTARERDLAWVALAGADLYLMALLTVHALAPDIDPLHDAISEYALTPSGLVVRLGTGALGAAAIACALALWTLLRARVGAVLLALFGLGQLGVAVFTVAPRGEAATTWAGTGTGGVATAAGAVGGELGALLHDVCGNVSFFVLPVAAVLLVGAAGRVPDWRARRAPLHAATLAVVATTVLVLCSERLGIFGVAQRAAMLAAVAWVVAASVSVLRARRIR